MNKNNTIALLKRKLIGDRAFYAQVIAIVIPIIIQNTVTNVVSLLDNVMVGRVGTLEMSAVAIVNQLMFVFNVCIFGGLSGAGIFATQYAGARDDEGVRHCFRIKWMIVLGMMAFALLVFLTIPERLIGIYLSGDARAEDVVKTLGFGMDYLVVMVWGLLPFAVAQVYASTLREIGETKLPMMASVIGILTNLVFNYLLIFGKFGFPQMGVTGAAVATVFSRYVEVAIIMGYTHAQRCHYTFIRGAYRTLRVPRNLFRAVGKKGMPLLVNEFFWSIGIAFLMQCYSVRGLDVVAATNIASTVSNLFKVVFMSMGSAVAIMVGQALGANEGEKAKDILTKSMKLSCKVTSAYMFLLFRAFEKANMYEATEPYIDSLRSLVGLGCTTTPEWVGEDVRSECHAWSAVAIYEFTAKVLGVTYKDGIINIEPYIIGRNFAKGDVATPVGMVYCEWRVEDKQFQITVKLPEGRTAHLKMPDNLVREVSSGKYICDI